MYYCTIKKLKLWLVFRQRNLLLLASTVLWGLWQDNRIKVTNDGKKRTKTVGSLNMISIFFIWSRANLKCPDIILLLSMWENWQKNFLAKNYIPNHPQNPHPILVLPSQLTKFIFVASYIYTTTYNPIINSQKPNNFTCPEYIFFSLEFYSPHKTQFFLVLKNWPASPIPLCTPIPPARLLICVFF